MSTKAMRIAQTAREPSMHYGKVRECALLKEDPYAPHIRMYHRQK